MGTAATRTAFPREFRGGVFKNLDKPFAGVFLVCTGLLFALAWYLSHRPVSHEVTSHQIMQIQERYARLVLNQPKPKPVEKPTETRKREAPAEKAEEKPTVDRAKESLVERQKRREQTQESRAMKRRQLDQQIASAGIFAAITSSSDESDGGVQDLIGTGDVSNNLSDLAISGQSFARKQVDVEERRRERRENRASAGTIARSSLQKAQEEKVDRRGSVNISETPQAVEGSARQSAQRTHEAIGAVIKNQQMQLVYVLEKWLKKDPNLSGKILLRFTIMPSGSVTGVTVVSSTTNNPEFDEAITRYVRRWTFSPIDESSGSVTVVYPFVFTGVR